MNSNTGVPTLGRATTNLVPVARPPREEQAAIADRIRAAFEGVARLQRLSDQLRTRAGQLDPAILARAFSGELVAKDAHGVT